MAPTRRLPVPEIPCTVTFCGRSLINWLPQYWKGKVYEALLDDGVGVSEGELGGGVLEAGDAHDARVLVVQVHPRQRLSNRDDD